MAAKVVANGEHVVLYINASKYLFVEVAAKKRVQVGKQNIDTSELEGKRYGASYSVDRGKLEPLKADDLMNLKNELAPQSEQDPDANNSLLVDDNSSQKLSQADIATMKSQGASGTDVIKAIVGNSSTFHTKTDYSKEKYLKKKSQKHITTVQILKGTANTILTAYYEKSPFKICSLRGDSLALLLNLSNIFAHPDKKVLVVENCQGLITGAVAERMGGIGRVFVGNLESSKPSMEALKSFNFSQQVKDSIVTIPISNLTLQSQQSEQQEQKQPDLPNQPEPEPEPEPETTEPPTDTTKGKDKNTDHQDKITDTRALANEQAQHLVREGADSLLVVSKYAPQSIVPRLVKMLKGGAAFAVYGQCLQPLAETHELLRNEGIATNMGLAETWLRVHQVLPARTHPNMQMDGASGYILNGIRVIPDNQQKEKPERRDKRSDNAGKGTKRKSSTDGADLPEQKQSKPNTENDIV